MRTRLSIVAVVLVAACAKTETPEQRTARMQAEGDSARTAVTARSAALAGFISANNADSSAAIYAEDAVFMPPNMATVTGRAGIREAFAGMHQGMGAGQMHFTTQNVSASGDIAVERGRWHWQPAEGNRMPADSGKYLVHWHRQGGTWMIVEDIFNADTPAVPAPVSRR